jgi:hypothetical protein
MDRPGGNDKQEGLVLDRKNSPFECDENEKNRTAGLLLFLSDHGYGYPYQKFQKHSFVALA